jgi:beta-glucosidase
LLRESELDEPLRRVLALKFRMGLFEDPRRADLARAAAVIKTPAHKELNLEAARQSLVLLQNNGALPLPAAVKKIAVVGPNADDDLAQLGDWSLGASQYDKSFGKHPRECTVTPFDGIRARAARAGAAVVYQKGCDNHAPADPDAIAAAVRAAAAADVVVCVVGDALQYAGEFHSTATLELPGGQIQLLDALAQLGQPLVVVLVNTKPLVLPPSARRADAIIELFNPGMAGGTALAEALFGDLNPSGKLTVSVPLHVGQQPVYYNRTRGQHGSYADITQEPLFPFGHGLSYTTYRYENLRVTPAADGGATVTVSVTNTGPRAGEEIAQVYVSDEVTSATWVCKELKGFARIPLSAGETRDVTVALPAEAFSFVNAAGERVIEPGRFKIHAGGSSRAADLLTADLTLGQRG